MMGGGENCDHLGRQNTKGSKTGKNEYFKWKKKLILCDQQIFKLLGQLKRKFNK